ncbi:AAA family ATPase [Mucisphaera sp.]|uniref:AAA family ATPase n=1 Tax=Mucisphaera sp. TaxID=2913024 RepID=UPI003D0DE1AD
MSESATMEQAERFRADYQRIREQVTRVIVGQQAVVDGALTALFVGGHVLLEGVPGLGKTLLVRTLAEAMSLDFSRIQFTPDLMPADITGTTIVVEGRDEQGQTVRDFQFRKGPIFSQIVLADEINRATPKTQSAMLEAMQERSVTVSGGAGGTYAMAKPFLVMATQNPIEQEGTYPLPEAQLDRFLFKLEVGFVSRGELHEIIDRTTGSEEAKVEPVLDGETILAHQRLVRSVIAAPTVRDYAVRAVLATHPTSEVATKMVKQFVRFGASPRAAQSLILAGKARALLEGRVHVAVEDIRGALGDALRHRVLMNFEGTAEGITPDLVIQDLVNELPAEAAGVPGVA